MDFYLVGVKQKGFIAEKMPKNVYLQKLIFKLLGIKPIKYYEPTTSMLLEVLSSNPKVSRIELENDLIFTLKDTINVTGKAVMLLIQTEDLSELG